ncbi:hypothetical protein Tco_1010966 [Tanacetum coccineum]
MAQQQHVADVHPDELCPPNNRYDLMDANKKVDLEHVQCPSESKIRTNIIKNHPLRFSRPNKRYDLMEANKKVISEHVQKSIGDLSIELKTNHISRLSVSSAAMAEVMQSSPIALTMTLYYAELLGEGLYYALSFIPHSSYSISRFYKDSLLNSYMTIFPDISRPCSRHWLGPQLIAWMIEREYCDDVGRIEKLRFDGARGRGELVALLLIVRSSCLASRSLCIKLRISSPDKVPPKEIHSTVQTALPDIACTEDIGYESFMYIWRVRIIGQVFRKRNHAPSLQEIKSDDDDVDF